MLHFQIFTSFILLLTVHRSTSFTSRSGSDRVRNRHRFPGHHRTQNFPFPVPPTRLLPCAAATNDDTTPLRGRQRIPTILTCARCAAIPPLLWTFYRGPVVGSVAIFVAASLTDLLDGYLARRWKATSAFGAFLDPVVRISYRIHVRT